MKKIFNHNLKYYFQSDEFISSDLSLSSAQPCRCTPKVAPTVVQDGLDTQEVCDDNQINANLSSTHSNCSKLHICGSSISENDNSKLVSSIDCVCENDFMGQKTLDNCPKIDKSTYSEVKNQTLECSRSSDSENMCLKSKKHSKVHDGTRDCCSQRVLVEINNLV